MLRLGHSEAALRLARSMPFFSLTIMILATGQTTATPLPENEEGNLRGCRVFGSWLLWWLVVSLGLCKFAVAFARATGVHSDNVAIRSCWKMKSDGGASNKVINKCHISPHQPFVNANVAVTLCLSSPIAHHKHPRAIGWLTNKRLLVNVTPCATATSSLE